MAGAAEAGSAFLTNPPWEGEVELIHGQSTTALCPGEVPRHERVRLIRERLGAQDFTSVVMDQVHGRHTAFIDAKALSEAEDGLLVIPETDAVVTEERGILLHVQTADCVPILAVDLMHGVIGAAHCGWRGTAKKLGAKLIRDMVKIGADADRIQVWLGAAISGKAYEVGPEVLKKFTGVTNWWAGIDHDKRLVDLSLINRLQIARAGIPPERMAHCDLCTFGTPDLLHSYRRDAGDPGRMHAVIGLRRG